MSLVTFQVQVSHRPGLLNENVNWETPDGRAINSQPDMLPEDGTIWFVNVPPIGHLALNYQTGLGPHEWRDALESVDFTATSGAIYEWDARSNRVGQVNHPALMESQSMDLQGAVRWATANPALAGIGAAVLVVAAARPKLKRRWSRKRWQGWL